MRKKERKSIERCVGRLTLTTTALVRNRLAESSTTTTSTTPTPITDRIKTQCLFTLQNSLL